MQPHQLGLEQTDFYRLEVQDGRDTLVLVFSHLEEPVGRFSLHRTVSHLDANCLLMNTPQRSYYALGVPGLGNTVGETVASLRRIVAALQPRAVVTIGISMGGYAALLFGALLPADRILALSPETLLMLPGSRSRAALRGRVQHDYPNLLPLLRNAQTGKIAVYFGETDLHDVHAAWRLRALPQARLFSVQGAGHEIGRWFSDNCLLQQLVHDFVYEGALLEDFPRRGFALEHGRAIGLTMQAHRLMAARRPGVAIALLRRAIGIAPGLDLACYTLGRALSDIGRPREAVSAFRAAVELAPECDHYRLHYGRALLGCGDQEAAETVIRATMAETPDKALAHDLLGLAAEQRGDRGAAEAAYQLAVSLDDSNATFFHHLGALQMATGRWAEAERSYRRAVDLNVGQAFLHAQLGRSLLAQGRAVEAAACIHHARQLSPDVEPYAALAEEVAEILAHCAPAGAGCGVADASRA
jgi:Flp pilus assembly protein TadD